MLAGVVFCSQSFSRKGLPEGGGRFVGVGVIRDKFQYRIDSPWDEYISKSIFGVYGYLCRKCVLDLCALTIALTISTTNVGARLELKSV